MAISLLHSEFVRVDEKCPCPICGHPDWCMISKNGKTAICPRTESNRRWGDIGYLHQVKDNQKRVIPIAQQRKILSSPAIERYLAELGKPPKSLMEQHCAMLGLERRSLDWFDARYEKKSATLVFPMRDGNLKLVGCRNRRRDGKKWSLKGGREGLYVGRKLDLKMPLVVTEGATDAVAAYQAGLVNVVGRSNCMCGGRHLARLMRNNPRTPIILLADPDEVGEDYGKDLAFKSGNPTIVLAGSVDVRTYVKTLRTDLFRAVVNALDQEQSDWRIIYRNMMAIGVPFTQKVINALKHCRDTF